MLAALAEDVMSPLKSLIVIGLVAASLGSAAGSPIGTVTRMEQSLQVRLTESLRWLPCKLGHLLNRGDMVRTSAKGRAEISYRDGTIARMGPLAVLHLDQLRQRPGRLGWGRFLAGSVWLKIAKGSRAEIVTPAAVASVVGTEFVLDVSEAQATKIVVLEGGVDFTGSMGDTVRVKGGYWGEAIPGKKMNPPQPITPEAERFAKSLASPLTQSSQ
jgi:hypothetical protein